MTRTFTVMRQELKMTAANRAFVVVTVIGPLLIVALSVLPGLFGTGGRVEPGTVVAMIGGDPALFDDARSAAASENIILIRKASLTETSPLVLDGELEGALVLPPDYLEAPSFRFYSKSGADLAVSEALSKVFGTLVVERRLTLVGIDPSMVKSLSSRPTVVSERLTSGGHGERQDLATVILTTIAFVLLLYMTVLLYGQMIGRSVVTEKSSKTVEIMLSSVSPSELLFGKILGKGLAGLLQYAIWIAIALLLTRLIGPAAGLSLPSGLTPANLLFLVLFFVLAFFLYASIFAALGAGAQDDQHLGQLAWPFVIFLILPLVMISVFVTSPDAPITQLFSLFPLTAPIVMFIRILVAPPAGWEVLLCVGILLLSIAGTVLLAARIFRVGILLTGKRATLPEMLRWVKR